MKTYIRTLAMFFLSQGILLAQYSTNKACEVGSYTEYYAYGTPHVSELGWGKLVQDTITPEFGYIQNGNGQNILPDTFNFFRKCLVTKYILAKKVNGKWGVYNEVLREAISFNYEDLFFSYVGKEFTCLAKKEGKWGLLDQYEEELLPFEYDNIKILTQDILILEKDQKLFVYFLYHDSLVDVSGYCVQAFDEEHNNYLKLIKKDTYRPEEGIINREGSFMIPILKGNISKINSEERPPYFKVTNYSVGEVSLYDSKGRLVLPPVKGRSLYISGNNPRYITVTDKKKKYFFNMQGKNLLPQDYDELKVIDRHNSIGLSTYILTKDGVNRLFKNGTYLDLDFEGIEKITGTSSFIFYHLNQAGIYDANKNQVVLEPKYDFIEHRHNTSQYSIVKLKNNGKYGLCQSNGEIIVTPKYSSLEAQYLSNWVHYKVVLNDRIGILDIDGNYVLDPAYDEIRPSKNAYTYKQGDNWGLLDLDTDTQIAPFSEKPLYLVEGLMPYRLGGLDGVMDMNKMILLEPQYDEIRAYQEQRARVRHNGKWGFIDDKQQIVIPIVYDEAKPFSKGRAWVKQGESEYYVDKEGNRLSP